MAIGRRVKVQFEDSNGQFTDYVGTIMRPSTMANEWKIKFDDGDENIMGATLLENAFSVGTRVQIPAFYANESPAHGVVQGWDGGMYYHVYYDDDRKSFKTHGNALTLSNAAVVGLPNHIMMLLRSVYTIKGEDNNNEVKESDKETKRKNKKAVKVAE